MPTNQILLLQRTEACYFEADIKYGEKLENNKMSPFRYINVADAIKQGWRLLGTPVPDKNGRMYTWIFEKYVEPFAEPC